MVGIVLDRRGCVVDDWGICLEGAEAGVGWVSKVKTREASCSGGTADMGGVAVIALGK